MRQLRHPALHVGKDNQAPPSRSQPQPTSSTGSAMPAPAWPTPKPNSPAPSPAPASTATPGPPSPPVSASPGQPPSSDTAPPRHPNARAKSERQAGPLQVDTTMLETALPRGSQYSAADDKLVRSQSTDLPAAAVVRPANKRTSRPKVPGTDGRGTLLSIHAAWQRGAPGAPGEPCQYARWCSRGGHAPCGPPRRPGQRELAPADPDPPAESGDRRVPAGQNPCLVRPPCGRARVPVRRPSSQPNRT
jgi:hypothetical protein